MSAQDPARTVGNNQQPRALVRAFTRRCPECGRVFDLLDEADANEWSYGHDCPEDEITREGRALAQGGLL